MCRVITIGETVYDIVFRKSKPVAAIPGGAMLNSAVSLGRIGLPVSYITELGNDEIGNLIFDFLNNNNIDTSYVTRFEEGKTALSLAFLDENEKATYSFYKQYPEKRLTAGFPDTGKDDIILFGSFFSLSDEVREPLISFIDRAFHNKSLIIYDPNYRKPHGSELPNRNDYLKENILLARIVRGSDEDFSFICKARNAKEAFDFVRDSGCEVLIYTRGDKDVEFRSERVSFSVPVPKVKTVSTIGAGDSFNAGLIYGLFNKKINSANIDSVSQKEWKSIIETAISFGSYVCGSYENYVSTGFAAGYKRD